LNITEVPIDLKLEGKPLIIGDGTLKSCDQENYSSSISTSHDISSTILGKARLSIAKHL